MDPKRETQQRNHTRYIQVVKGTVSAAILPENAHLTNRNTAPDADNSKE